MANQIRPTTLIGEPGRPAQLTMAGDLAASTSDMMSKQLAAHFHEILQGRRLHPIFQPIVDLDQRQILGYESLIRGPSDSPLLNPLALFEVAIRLDRLFELELLCREIAVQQFQRMQLPGKLFLNTSPASLVDEEHQPGHTLEQMHRSSMDPQNVVIELTEQFPLDDYDVMRKATRHYRAMGFEIAIDDLGAGYAGLRMWSELRPDYVKIDKHFVQDIHLDNVKQEFVRSIISIAKGTGCQVVAEGIETQQEYATVADLGIGLAQGYYLARPHAVPPRTLNNELFAGDPGGIPASRPMYLSDTAATLLTDVPSVHPFTKVDDVMDLFYSTPSLLSVAVLAEDGRPLGLARRYRLTDMYASPYGRHLNGKKPIAQFMDSSCLVVDQDIMVERASQAVTDNMQLRVEDDFVITARGKFRGVGKVVDLLKKITELQVRNARYANPLTLLPGNVPIYDVLDRHLQGQTEFSVAYCDLDYFKPFNDVYGYGKGDEVLKRLAAIMTHHADPQRDFVGHLGGDDFIIVFESPDWESRCEAIAEQFGEQAEAFYNDTDRLAGGIRSADRTGTETFYPILSLSIGVVRPDVLVCRSHNEVAAMASEAKRQAKQCAGNCVFYDRRRIP